MKRLEKILESVPREDFVFSQKPTNPDSPYDSQWAEYAMQRLAWKGKDGKLVSPEIIKEKVSKIVILNGYTSTESLEMFDALSMKKDIVSVDFNLGREKGFLHEKTGVLYIAQPVSKVRGDRFVDMLYTGCVKEQKDWKVEVVASDDTPQKRITALTNYENRAYDFVKELSLRHDMLKDIDYVTLGPIKWMAKHTKSDADVRVLERHLDDDYLAHMITEVIGENGESKKVLNIDYVFADQAANVIDKLLLTYHACTDDAESRTLHLLMYGKVGGIKERLHINDLVFPNGLISEYDIVNGNSKHTPMYNVFEDYYGKNEFILNETSVPLQRKSVLIDGSRRDCSVVEMEALHATLAINAGRNIYHNLNINHGFATFISDLPLQEGATTLANGTRELLEPGMKSVVDVVVDYVKRH